MILSQSWRHYFDSLESNEMTNRHISRLTSATTITDDTTDTLVIRTLTEDRDAVLMVVAPVTKEIKVLHSCENLGGKRTRPDNKIVALDGFDDKATPVVLSVDSTVTRNEFRTPSNSTFRTFDTIEAVKNSTTPTSGSINFKHCSLIFLPPFLTTLMMREDTRDPHELFMLCKNEMENFDTQYSNDNSIEKSMDKGKDILRFLWAATKDLIQEFYFVPGTDDREVKRWSNQRHHTCIQNVSMTSPTTAPSPIDDTVVQSLADSINNQSNLLEAFRQEKAEEKEKTNRFDALHDSSKLLILNASADGSNITPSNPTTTCEEFFKKKNLSKASDYLITTLTQDYECCVQIDTGLITALFSGHFLRDREDSPSNFSFFLTPKKQPMAYDRFKPTMILQLKATNGKGWSETDLKDALKQGIVTPPDMTSFSHQLKNLWGLSVFFFGPQSKLSMALSPLMAKIQRHTLTFEGAQVRDPTFATKLGYCIDTRIFRWLEQCRNEIDRNDVNDSLLSFNLIIDQVLTDSFVQYLPSTFKSFTKPEEEKKDDDIQTITPTKRNRGDDIQPRRERRAEENSQPIKDWIVSNDEYKRFFAGKFLKDRPIMSGKPLCQRFHSKGYCFSDCPNKITHVASSNLNTETKSAYQKYVEKCKTSK